MRIKISRFTRHRRQRQNLKLVAMIFCLFLAVPDTSEAEWDFYPALRIAADFDDNATLTSRTDEIERISGVIGEASVGIAYNSTTGLFFIEPVVRTRRYDSDINRDSDDQFLYFRMQHRGRLNTLSMRGEYSNESVRTAELADDDLDEDIDPDEIEDDDTGLTNLRQRREKLRVVPRWQYRFSDKSSFLADVNFVTVDFDDEQQQLFQLTDYTDARARFVYTRALSTRNKALVVASARNYQTEFLDGDFSGYGVGVGFDRAVSETSNFRAVIGVEKTEQINVNDEKPRGVADISYVRRQETTRLLLQYRRRIAASGRGALAARDEVILRFVRDLNDRLAAGIGARAYESTRLGIIPNETTFVQLNAQLLWRLSKSFSLQGIYRHTVIDRGLVGESANSNRFTLWFSYQPNSESRLRLSRY